jgi:hypothetical protein
MTEDQTQALTTIPSHGGAGLNVFSSSGEFETGQRMAKALAASTLVPKEYQNNLPNVLVAFELAGRIGASVFAVMQNIDIIHGRPSWRATFLIATVNACGRFSPLRFRFQGKEGTASWGCRAYAKDRESGEECVGSLITLALADAEGWSKKSGSKWKTMPEQMLCYRAAAFWSRIYAPELSLGMHTRDELEDAGAVSQVRQMSASGSSPAAALLDAVVAEASVVQAPASDGEAQDGPDQVYDHETGEVHEFDDMPMGDDQ